MSFFGDVSASDAPDIEVCVSAGISILSTALQCYVIRQNYNCHKEEVNADKKHIELDSLALRLDALSHGKEEIKRLYKTYESMIETYLIVMTLLFPYALSVIQFSDPFMPQTNGECPSCVESHRHWVIHVWVCLMAVLLVLPFWGILLLVSVKWRLDAWLEKALVEVYKHRADRQPEDWVVNDADDAEHVVRKTNELVQSIVHEVDKRESELTDMWHNVENYSRRVHIARIILVVSITLSVILSSISVWLYLYNEFSDTGDIRRMANVSFGVMVSGGTLAPYVVYFGYQFFVRPRRLLAGRSSTEVAPKKRPRASTASSPAYLFGGDLTIHARSRRMIDLRDE